MIGHFIRLPYVVVEKARVWILKSWSWKKEMSNIPLGFNTFGGTHHTHTVNPYEMTTELGGLSKQVVKIL